jgi:hypothetical protein
MRLLAALLLGFVFLLAVPPNSMGGPGHRHYREGELLVQFRRGAAEADRERLHQRLQGKAMRRLKGDVDHVQLPQYLDVKKAIAIYRADPLVEHAEPNYLVQRAILPNDSNFTQQWYLYNSGQRFAGNQRGTFGVDIGAPEAWDLHTGSAAIIVAVLDSGIDYLHPDLADNIWSNPGEIANGQDSDGNGKVDDLRGWNFIANTSDPMDDDPSSHGTHIAGIIGAIGNNARGVSGINWRVQLMPLKFLAADGSGSVAHAIAAIDYAITHGARVINASYGYPDKCTTQPPSTFERQAIERAGQAGVLFVAAAGNSGCDNDLTPFYPASHNLANILAVAASDAHDNLATFSNYGRNSVHLAAPGTSILSTLHRHRGEYGYISGTSMAAPMVSGAATLLFSYRPELPWHEARQLLLDNSLPLPNAEDKIAYGRLDITSLLNIEAETPIAPRLNIHELGEDFLELRWEDRSRIEESHELERRIGIHAPFSTLAILPADADNFRDQVATGEEGTALLYRVRAVTGQGFSSLSNEVAHVVPVLPPQNLLLDVDQNAVLLSWEDHSQVETGYEVERREGSLPFQKLAKLEANAIEYTDATIVPGRTYIYRVRALHDLAGPSEWSEENTVSFGTVSLASANGSGGGPCFIATAAYGSPLHPKVEVLRKFRDKVLLTRWWGRWINDIYLRLSPPLARAVEHSGLLRHAARTLLRPIIAVVQWWHPAAASTPEAVGIPPQETAEQPPSAPEN